MVAFGYKTAFAEVAIYGYLANHSPLHSERGWGGGLLFSFPKKQTRTDAACLRLPLQKREESQRLPQPILDIPSDKAGHLRLLPFRCECRFYFNAAFFCFT